VIVAGYGSAARYLTRVLRDSGVPFVILTLSPTGATDAKQSGLTVILGDYSKRFLLSMAAVENAKMLVIPDDTPDMAKRVIAVARLLMPASYVRLSAGRSDMTDETQALCFLAGANSIFYGEKLLTTENPTEHHDRGLFEQLGIRAEAHIHGVGGQRMRVAESG
jgi:voltage-gated potassium channel Kch